MPFEPGQIAHVCPETRVIIPVDVLRAVSWWSGESTKVTVELAEPGLIRVFSAEQASDLIQALKDGLADLPPEERFEQMAVLNDRYRDLTLYADGRLRVTKDIAPILGFKLGERTTLFAQPFSNGLEIMSFTFRAERLLRHPISIGLHLTDA